MIDLCFIISEGWGFWNGPQRARSLLTAGRNGRILHFVSFSCSLLHDSGVFLPCLVPVPCVTLGVCHCQVVTVVYLNGLQYADDPSNRCSLKYARFLKEFYRGRDLFCVVWVFSPSFLTNHSLMHVHAWGTAQISLYNAWQFVYSFTRMWSIHFISERVFKNRQLCRDEVYISSFIVHVSTWISYRNEYLYKCMLLLFMFC